MTLSSAHGIPKIFYSDSFKGYFHDSLCRLRRRGYLNPIANSDLICHAPSIGTTWHPPLEVNYSIVCPFNAPDIRRDNFCDFLSKKVALDINNGVCRVFFDNSNEKCGQDSAEAIASRVSSLGVTRLRNIYLICQDRSLHAKTQLNVLNHDYFILQAWDSISSIPSVSCSSLKMHKTLHSLRKPFLCLNATPRALRVITLIELLRSGLWSREADKSHTIVSFPGFNYVKNSGLELDTVNKLLRDAGYTDVDSDIRWIADYSPFVADTVVASGNELSSVFDLRLYCDTVSSIVTETECRSDVCRFTEKTFKAFALGHLPIVIGNPGSMKLAKAMGFETYDEIVELSYDMISSPLERVQSAVSAAKDLLQRIQSSPIILHKIAETASFNIEWTRTGFAPQYIRGWTDQIFREMLFLA